MEEKNSKLLNDISRLMGTIALFWAMVTPILSFPFFIIGFVFGYKNRNSTEGRANILFNSIGALLSLLYLIFSLLYNAKN